MTFSYWFGDLVGETQDNENGATVRTKNILTGEWGSWTSGEPTNPVAPSDLVEPPLTPPPSQPEAPEEGLGTNPLAMQSLTEPLVTNPLIQPESLVTDPIVQPEPTPMESPITDEPLNTQPVDPSSADQLPTENTPDNTEVPSQDTDTLPSANRRRYPGTDDSGNDNTGAITLALMMGLER